MGLVTSLLPPRGSLTGKLHHACVDTGLAEGRMHRFEADGNLHKRPFRNCPLQTPQPAFRLLAVHIRVPHGNTRAFRAFLVREGRETMVYFWGSSTYRRRLAMMAASFGCGTGLLAAFFSSSSFLSFYPAVSRVSALCVRTLLHPFWHRAAVKGSPPHRVCPATAPLLTSDAC